MLNPDLEGTTTTANGDTVTVRPDTEEQHYPEMTTTMVN